MCELVFNTSMVGYQEIVSDPSYTNQAVVMTYPLIGNYGIADDDFETKRSHASAALMVREYNDQPSNFRYTRTLSEILEENHIPGIEGIDTRKLTRSHSRHRQSPRAYYGRGYARWKKRSNSFAQRPFRTTRFQRVSCKKRWYSRTANHRFNVVAVDCGIKLNIVRSLNARGCNVTVVPWNTAPDEIRSMQAGRRVPLQRPGRPGGRDAGDRAGARPARQSCPSLASALAIRSFPWPTARAPTSSNSATAAATTRSRTLETGKIEITSQNHSYAVDADALAGTGLELTHINLLDNTVEGVRCERRPGVLRAVPSRERARAAGQRLSVRPVYQEHEGGDSDMPKRTDIQKILVIGSGPIVIGQAAEFDYAGTQACLALKEEGYEVILVNSNPATIMTDTSIADKVYMEPLKLEYLAKILRYERPDAIVPGIGGQTGLESGHAAWKRRAFCANARWSFWAPAAQSIERAEDRELFKAALRGNGRAGAALYHRRIPWRKGLPPRDEIGYPVVLRPAFTLGGTGGGFADNDEELQAEIMKNALKLSPVHQVLVEKSIKGYKEIEYEVMRDKNDTAITICNMENIDPVGIHTGDSIVVAPSQTLTNKEYHLLRDSALKIIRALKIEGGCNVQFALDPESFNYYRHRGQSPRVALLGAGFQGERLPIARVSAKIAVGMTLDEIRIANTPASFEPTLDYVVTKMARFPFDKFATASNKLSTQMKATGEVMSVGRTIEESLLKAVRSLEIGVCHLHMAKFDSVPRRSFSTTMPIGTDDRICAVAELFRAAWIPIASICDLTQIDMLFP